MNNLDQILDKALEMLQNGHSKEEVLLEYKNQAKELAPLLDISLNLFTLPKKLAPEPAMQRKYILAPSKSFWLAWLHISKFAGVSMSVILLLSAFTFTTIASLRSGPGQVLFSVKKTTEKLQLILAYNQDQKANLQIKLTQKRLNEAREIFNNPNSDIKEEQAALKELSDQTSNTIAVVNTVTKNNPSSDKNHPLLVSLETIAKDQQNLLSEIKPNNNLKLEALSAQQTLNENSAKITEIKNFVTVASNEQSLTQINPDSNSVIISGEIVSLSKEQITVDKTTFNITNQTVFKNSSNENLQFSELKVKNKVTVMGTKNSDTTTATQITLTPSETEQLVKGDSTSTVPTISASATTSTIKKPEPTTNPVDPNQAIGSFILEDPSPQFQKE